MAKYVVVADAVTVTVGKKANGRPEYTRVNRRGIINGEPDSERIKFLVRAGSIVRAKSPEHAEELKNRRQTVRDAAMRMGAADDPVQAPVSGVAPLPAPLPEESPGAILAGAE